jgi:hypothetical protein
VYLKEAQEKKTIVMFCEGHVSLKEPFKKCKLYSYFAYFLKEPQKNSG